MLTGLGRFASLRFCILICSNHDVDNGAGLSSLEEVEKPIETSVVPVHPDQLKSGDHKHDY